ncbi:class I SAM-dependent methyltransferase [Methanolobus sp. ZRKC3]|uniref:class I SAM-dependent methyltransferase n=1 Tax=Methanolobus sp. ZRKC3 TaxID=3125786 RepID=UPI0032464820
MGGKHYDFFATILGFGSPYYEQVASELPLKKGMSILDLGCGTESVGIAIARQLKGEIDIHGIDLSAVQLGYAAKKAGGEGFSFDLCQGSMDMLPYGDASFDMVVTSVAFCETSAEVRKGAISETGRVLKKGDFFALVDCSRPRLAFSSVMMLPFFMFKENGDSWNNHYLEMCEENNLKLVKDVYLKSYVRCQVFEKI